MVQLIRPQGITLRFVLLALLLVLLVVVVQSIVFTDILALAFSFDFLVTLPFVYLLLIRKTKVPNITVVPFSLAMLLLGFFFMPEAHQQYLYLYQLYFLPVLELGVLVVVVLKMRKARKMFTATEQGDTYSRLHQVARQFIDVPRAAEIVATEMATIYYAVVAFRRSPAGKGFSYHRETGLTAMMGALMLIVVVETVAVHILVEMFWSTGAAYVLSILSIYSLITLLGIVGASRFRKHQVAAEVLQLRFGLQEAQVHYQQIQKLQKWTKEVPKVEGMATMALLGNVNMMLSLTSTSTLSRSYGIRTSYKYLAFWADDPDALLLAVEQAKTENVSMQEA